MGALLSHHVGRALGNSGADHHGATVHPGDDPPGVPEGCVDELGWTNRWDDDDDDDAAERRRPPRRRPKQKLRGASNRRPAKRRGAAAADDESSGTEVEEVDDDDVERARRPAATTTRQWRPLRGQEGTSDHTRRVLELAGLPQRHRGGFEL